ncbi:MAG: hypothetical protein ACJ71Y_10505 [Blastococcus sp.]
MELEFRGEVWSWRGPSPHHFVTVPASEGAELRATSAMVTYGCGGRQIAVGDTVTVQLAVDV